MIQDLSLTLRALLIGAGSDFAELSVANVSFDRPADSFNPTQPTISLYLYDVRENLELRSSEREVRIVDGRFAISPAPLRLQCTYLLTAWPGNVTGDALALAEQTLLSQALMVLARYPRIPAAYLKGDLVGQDLALPQITAQAEGLRNPSEFWAALANKLRPSLSVAVTITLRPAVPADAPPVASSELRLSRDGIAAADVFAIGGTVSDGQAPLADVVLTLPKLSVSATSGSDGRYRFAGLPAGDHPLQLRHGSATRDLTLHVPAAAAAAYDIELS